MTIFLLQSEGMFKFSDIVEIQEQSKCVTEKNISDGKEMTENINDRSKTEFLHLKIPQKGIELHQINCINSCF